MPETRRKRRNVNAQEETVSALWRFAEQIGAPINESGVANRGRLDAVGVALHEIMDAFGYTVTEIQ